MTSSDMPGDRNLTDDVRIHTGDRYQRTYAAVHQVNDIPTLEGFVLSSFDPYERVFAFCRLTGWTHWEECDSYSHLTYACGHVEGYPDERALWLCDQVLAEMGCGISWHNEPMSVEDVLREGAIMVPELLLFGQNFLPSVSYVAMLARQEAAALGCDPRRIELWLLGILRFAQMGDAEIHNVAFPLSPLIDAMEDGTRCREVLSRYGIEASRLEPILLGVLAREASSTGLEQEGPDTDDVSLATYFNFSSRRAGTRVGIFEVADLLEVIMRRPTDDVRLALMRLGLILTLESMVPPELRHVPKSPYRPHLFTGDHKLTEVDLNMVDFSHATSLADMFSGCSSLRAVDLSPLATAPVTDMSGMFMYCSSLEELDLSLLDTSRVTDMSFAFYCCSALGRLDLTPLDMGHVLMMGHMLQSCRLLEEIRLCGLDTSSVIDISFLFSSCCSLRQIDLRCLDLRSVQNMMGVFDDCTSLTRVSLSGLDLSSVRDMTYLFQECTSLEEVDFSGVITSDILYAGFLFNGCSALRSVDLRPLTLVSGAFASRAFEGCDALESFGIPATWPLNEESALPRPTATCGKWWSLAAGKWMSVEQIMRRGSCEDFFLNHEP